MRDEIYGAMSNMMHSATEEEFEERYHLLQAKYLAHPNIDRYVTNGWCSHDCMWRTRWPKFGRLFNYGNVDTTNLVERLWQYIRYTLLNAQTNRSILELLHSIVGDSSSGTHMGGTLLEFFKQKQEIGKKILCFMKLPTFSKHVKYFARLTIYSICLL